MNKSWYLLSYLIFFLLLMNCGGTRLPEQQHSISWADLLNTSKNMTSELTKSEIEKNMLAALERSGHFTVNRTDAGNIRVSPALVDTTSGIDYLVQCEVVRQQWFVRKRTLVPFLLYRPVAGVQWDIVLNVIHVPEKKFAYSGNVAGIFQKSAAWDVTDFDPSDPDLHISETEKEMFEMQALEDANQKMIKIIVDIVTKE